ncbi:unnamed protein product [Zymoseptoria tritici ST99CH_3D1]|uniref:SnoaL-like domain-containing protein n=1 Tax=Zymoseptoria tritici (strain ST99CH_3D7) TaxID=1276538 RepID=A0A1X7RPT2_ZYMT9|nr:unnamed protein product [Zymoseptoria tritici ST99CH_3D7]SMR49985.1 unnamed protein product [Zymoseptoria tritici ST99CH_3D1]
MQLSSLIVSMCLSGMANAVTLSDYRPQAGVEGAFKDFLQALYSAAEDPKATKGFTDFFVPTTGQLFVKSLHGAGASKILGIKQMLMPTDGHKHWNHYPGVAKVGSETDTSKIYNVVGQIDTRYDGGNCSSAHFETNFEVLKDASGDVRLAPGSGSLALYDDYVVEPEYTPTEYPCHA